MLSHKCASAAFFFPQVSVVPEILKEPTFWVRNCQTHKHKNFSVLQAVNALKWNEGIWEAAQMIMHYAM